LITDVDRLERERKARLFEALIDALAIAKGCAGTFDPSHERQMVSTKIQEALNWADLLPERKAAVRDE
jgi:hypothetical protein